MAERSQNERSRSLDTTKATIEGVSNGVLEHERGSSWHFMDEGGFFSPLLMNHLPAGS